LNTLLDKFWFFYEENKFLFAEVMMIFAFITCQTNDLKFATFHISMQHYINRWISSAIIYIYTCYPVKDMAVLLLFYLVIDLLHTSNTEVVLQNFLPIWPNEVYLSWTPFGQILIFFMRRTSFFLLRLWWFLLLENKT
jgi:hypothetical protein